MSGEIGKRDEMENQSATRRKRGSENVETHSEAQILVKTAARFVFTRLIRVFRVVQRFPKRHIEENQRLRTWGWWNSWIIKSRMWRNCDRRNLGAIETTMMQAYVVCNSYYVLCFEWSRDESWSSSAILGCTIICFEYARNDELMVRKRNYATVEGRTISVYMIDFYGI